MEIVGERDNEAGEVYLCLNAGRSLKPDIVWLGPFSERSATRYGSNGGLAHSGGLGPPG